MTPIADPKHDDAEREHTEELIDEANEESFPASDPPVAPHFD